MSVDIVIVNYNTCALLRECLQSIESTRAGAPDLRTFVVDNASRDGSREMVRAEFPRAESIALDDNIGFGPGNNRGAAAGAGAEILFLNSDARLTDGALASMRNLLHAHPRCVAVGPRLAHPDGSFHPSCRRFPTVLRNVWWLTGLQQRFPNRPRGLQNWLSEPEHVSGAQVDMVSGACFLMRRDYFESLGGFDENMFLYEEEFDLFYPARRRGLEVRFCAEALVVHGAGSSVSANDLREFARFHGCRSKYYAFRKHYGRPRARMVYLADRGVYGARSLSRRITGRSDEEMIRMARICRDAWRASLDLLAPSSERIAPGKSA